MINDSGGERTPTEDDGVDCVDEGRSKEDTLQDYYYSDGITSRELVDEIYRRYQKKRAFTYFGNVLLYLVPPGGEALDDEYAKHLFSTHESEAHLFALLNELLHATVATHGRAPSGTRRSTHDHTTAVSSITDTLFEDASARESQNNCNLFVYGDASYAQLDVAKHAAVYLAQNAHVIGLEPTGTMSERVTAVNDLLELFSDYASHDRLFRNMQMTYRLNFDSGKHLSSVSVVPNLATDVSCAAVSSTYRKYLGSRRKDPSLRDVVIRPPSIFYALLYSVIHGKFRRWVNATRLTPRDAHRLLAMMPPHEVSHPEHHIAVLEGGIRLLMRIGFSHDELQALMQLLVAVLLFDTCAAVRAKNAEKEALKTQGNDPDLNQPPPSDPMAVQSDTDASSTPQETPREVLNPKDVLIFAADVLEIPLFRVPAKSLDTNELLFRLDLLAAENLWQFDNLAPALFIRLKHAIYRKANSYLVFHSGVSTHSSIAIHCNAGCFPQSLRVNQHGDVELARRASEEAFVHGFVSAMQYESKTTTWNAEFARRSAAAMSLLGGDTGLLAKIVIVAQKNADAALPEHPYVLADAISVQHSWHDVPYDVAAVLKQEATMFALPKAVCRLLGYTKNMILQNLLISKRSLHTAFGACAAALSYIGFLNECIHPDDRVYSVVCTNLQIARKCYKARGHKKSAGKRSSQAHHDETHKPEEAEQDVAFLERALSTNVPLLGLCIMQRDHSQVTLDLSSALATFLPLAYVALQPSLHRTIPLMEDCEAFTLLMFAVKAPTTAYRVQTGVVTMKRALCVKLVARASRYHGTVYNSVRLIQRWWEGYNTIQLKRVLCRVVVRIQSRARRLMFQDRVPALSAARDYSTDFIGLCAVIYHLNVSLLSSSQKTLQLLHSMEKRYHDKEFNHIVNAAATHIQACWRGRVARRRYAQQKLARFEDFAVMLVQASVRRFLATATLVRRKPTRDIAATCIQAAYRGYRARRAYEALSALKLALLSIVRKGAKLISLGDQLTFVKERKKHDTATMHMKRLIMMQTNLPPGFVKAQNMIRMHFVRKQYLHLRAAVEKVQALGLTKVARLGYLAKVRAAVTIQRWWRGTREPGLSLISGNALYYLNMREFAAAALLNQTLASTGVTLFHFRAYQDLRRVYPRSWAAEPRALLDHLLQVQRTLLDTGAVDCARITGLQFAIGAYHSLMLVMHSAGRPSAVYSWGGPDVLAAATGVVAQDARSKKQTLLHSRGLARPLEFFAWETSEAMVAGRPQLAPLPRVEIVSIACGNEFSLALDRQGQLFSWGDNRHGQCGQGHRLVRVWSPTMLALHGVTGVWCGEAHAVARLSVGDYFVFGRAFGYAIYAPEDLKAHCPAIRHQRIEAVACGGTLTVLYTAELRYVLRVLGGPPIFGDCYNLRGSIRSVCTNGRMISALVDNVPAEEGAAKQRVLSWGYLRCFSRHFKESLPNTAHLVSAYYEKFEHPERRKPRRSLVKVDSHLAKVCLLPMPVPVTVPKRVLGLACDHQQLLLTCAQGAVFGVQTFELLHDSHSDISKSDEHCIRLNPQVTGALLDPALYQFTALERVDAPVQLAYNRLSCSVGYAATGAPGGVP
ncbi:myosin head (motor domain) domain-containing protein [Babesia caballi]|uniref:Myosin head (Motor domain) domain-containing protein n=1 Tax=Babesia caballi TaxID=5871 RepID=A0AAV4LLT5_BABCB|nr:myosin head (motor domain) domain-containing protein [Babesia caballi]